MSINIENLTKLINHLRKVNDKNFNMQFWIAGGLYWVGGPVQDLLSEMERGEGGCGTAACIAGHAAMLKRAENEETFLRGGECRDARIWLGLDEELATELFVPDFLVPLNEITLDQALKTLEHLKETAEAGEPEVVWDE